MTLERLQAGLSVTVNAPQLAQAFRALLAGMQRLIQEAIRQAGSEPEMIYVTGGSARAPLVQQILRERFAQQPLVMGDAYGSVVSGLAMQAERLFGRRQGVGRSMG